MDKETVLCLWQTRNIENGNLNVRVCGSQKEPLLTSQK